MTGEKAKAIVHCDVENKVHTMKKVICHLQEVGRNRTWKLVGRWHAEVVSRWQVMKIWCKRQMDGGRHSKMMVWKT